LAAVLFMQQIKNTLPDDEALLDIAVCALRYHRVDERKACCLDEDQKQRKSGRYAGLQTADTHCAA
jgi:hypothetical protein